MAVIRVPGEGAAMLERILLQTGKKVGKVGWFEGARYPDERNKPGLPVALVAYRNEKGDPSRHIPARPYMEPTITAKRQEWKAWILNDTKRMMKGKITVEQALDSLGGKAAGDIRKTISLLTYPPLSPVTIEARLSRRKVGNAAALTRKKLSGQPLTAKESRSFGILDKPLIDTKHMYNTLTNVVEDA